MQLNLQKIEPISKEEMQKENRGRRIYWKRIGKWSNRRTTKKSYEGNQVGDEKDLIRSEAALEVDE